ncbi:hypothetical protein KY306_03025 [Candidatus Woesearchaeota archaeon]|nr:hypothetical protein [Candidatus Woesearchaeota archaeon]
MNFFKNKITLIISLIVLIVNVIFLFGYSFIGFGTQRYSFAFFEVSQAFYQTYAPIATGVHIILALTGLVIFIISLVFLLKK